MIEGKIGAATLRGKTKEKAGFADAPGPDEENRPIASFGATVPKKRGALVCGNQASLDKAKLFEGVSFGAHVSVL